MNARPPDLFRPIRARHAAQSLRSYLNSLRSHLRSGGGAPDESRSIPRPCSSNARPIARLNECTCAAPCARIVHPCALALRSASTARLDVRAPLW